MRQSWNHPLITLDHIYSYEEIKRSVYSLKERYPIFIQSKSIGKTYCNRQIPMLILGNGKKPFLFTAGIHGRETINTTVMLAMIEAYAAAFWQDEALCGIDMRKLFSKVRFYMIPLANPDGYEIARSGSYPLWKGNCRKVDLNRNFPSIHWKPKNQFDYPASERETRALMRVMNCIPAMGYIDYHSRGKSIFYYRAAMKKAYNERQLCIGEALAKAVSYTLEKPSDEINKGDSGGNTVHYFSETRKAPCFTIETAAEEEKFPLSPTLLPETFEEILISPLVFAETILPFSLIADK